MPMVSLLLLLCAAAPDWAAWLEDVAAVAPVDDVDTASDGADVASQRVRVLAAAVASTVAPLKAPVPRILAVTQAAPQERPRTRLVIGTSPAVPRGPPQG